jgi:hypothetical protein
MGKRVLVIIVALVAAIAAAVLAVNRDLFTEEGRTARLMRSLERSNVVMRRSCYSMEAFVNASRWSRMGESDQQRAARALAAYCAEQGSSGQMTIVDTDDGRKLAHWDGRSFQRF